MALCSLRDVTVRFGGVTALEDVSLELLGGELVALIGPNGAGKTTLFNVVSGIQRSNAGAVIFDQRPINDLDPTARARLGIGRTFQTPQAFGSLTVLENLLLPAWLPRYGGVLPDLLPLPGAGRARRAARERARGIADFLGIADTLERLPGELSLGRRRLVELGRALAAEPKLLLLDEPASGLDAAETERFAALLLRVRDVFRLTLLLVEHDMQLVLSVADYVYVLNFGKLLAQGEPQAVVSNPAVIAAYLGGASGADDGAAPEASGIAAPRESRSASGARGGQRR
ncbi:MAG TPA: ABC transporter ATP-binding protein [Ktedonobacterales bacterium]|nr:ABC transporter ATP-binding protein [Ktedonobacterales bacterium]